MRYAARRDANEGGIIKALRAVGVSVQALDAKGVPDLLLGYKGQNWLVEVKDPEKVPSKRQLTPDQVAWHGAWGGQAAIVETADEALRLVGVIA